MSVEERVLYSPNQAGNNTTESDGIVYPFTERGYIKSVYYEPGTAVTQSDTDYYTFSVSANATTSAAFTTQVTGGQAVVADTPVEMTIIAAQDKLELAEGDVITCASTKTGTGPAHGGRFMVLIEFARF